MTEPKPMGRPSKFTEELGRAICERLAQGESLRSICKDEQMPDKANVFRWLTDGSKAEFRDQYARARELQADVLFDECLEIADNATADFKERPGENGTVQEVVDHEHIARSRLRVDTRKWIAGKLAPKKYGERVTLDGKITTENTTPRATTEQAIHELGEIFGAAAASVAKPAAAKPGRRDRVVRPKPDKGNAKKPRTPAPG